MGFDLARGPQIDLRVSSRLNRAICMARDVLLVGVVVVFGSILPSVYQHLLVRIESGYRFEANQIVATLADPSLPSLAPFFSSGAAWLAGALISDALAQIEPPDPRFVFMEDRSKQQRTAAKKKGLQQRRKNRQTYSGRKDGIPLDIDAESLSADQTGKTIKADGDITMTYGGTIVDAKQGQVNVETRDVELNGDLTVSDTTASITADSGKFNLDTGAGTFNNASVYSEDGDYTFKGSTIERLAGSDEDYILRDANLSTCQCAEQGACSPWSFTTDEAKIRREGYGEAYNSFLRVCDVPVMYLPYIKFPVKNERQSGLLTPSVGINDRNGVSVQLPIYLALDHSTDATIMPVYQSEARLGADSEFRTYFSKTSQLEAGLVYFDESRRQGRLLGTNTQALFDPSLEKTREAAFLNYGHNGDVANHAYQVLLDGRYVSDDLLIREYQKQQIGDVQTRFLTSTALFRTAVLDSYSLDVSSEFNQAIVSDDSLVFQRLPEASMAGFASYRPFGDNDLGARLIHQSTYGAVNFQRTKNYDGARYETFQRVSTPFHVSNYFDAVVGGDVRLSQYQLDGTVEPIANAPADQPQSRNLPTNSDRAVPGFDMKLTSVLERVYDISDDNWIKTLAELGPKSRNERVARLKHTMEPLVRYRFVPEVDQKNNPQFDSFDRLANRNVVSYGLTQRLLARAEPRNQYLYGIEETTPELRDLGTLRTPGILDQKFAFGLDTQQPGDFQGLKQGSLRELVVFNILQSYELDPPTNAATGKTTDGLSDLNTGLTLLPNEYIKLRGASNFNIEKQDFTNYTIDAQVSNKRGDELRNRFGYTDGALRQLETGLEIFITDLTKVGYYSRYNDLIGKFQEQSAGLRLMSECKCWIFDLEFQDTLNPDQTRMMFSVTLVGLGGFGNNFFTAINNNAGSTLNQ